MGLERAKAAMATRLYFPRNWHQQTHDAMAFGAILACWSAPPVASHSVLSPTC